MYLSLYRLEVVEELIEVLFGGAELDALIKLAHILISLLEFVRQALQDVACGSCDILFAHVLQLRDNVLLTILE